MSTEIETPNREERRCKSCGKLLFPPDTQFCNSCHRKWPEKVASAIADGVKRHHDSAADIGETAGAAVAKGASRVIGERAGTVVGQAVGAVISFDISATPLPWIFRKYKESQDKNQSQQPDTLPDSANHPQE